jgi:hypothetical protein
MSIFLVINVNILLVSGIKIFNIRISKYNITLQGALIQKNTNKKTLPGVKQP